MVSGLVRRNAFSGSFGTLRIDVSARNLTLRSDSLDALADVAVLLSVPLIALLAKQPFTQLASVEFNGCFVWVVSISTGRIH